MDKHSPYGRGQDLADAYVDALVEWSGWTVKVDWEERFDANLPKKEKKVAMPLAYNPKSRL